MSEMFGDIKGVEVVVDDVLIWGETDEHDARLQQVLKRARHRNLKLNKDKVQSEGKASMTVNWWASTAHRAGAWIIWK